MEFLFNFFKKVIVTTSIALSKKPAFLSYYPDDAELNSLISFIRNEGFNVVFMKNKSLAVPQLKHLSILRATGSEQIKAFLITEKKKASMLLKHHKTS